MCIFCISILFFILIFILLLRDLSHVVRDSTLEKNPELQKGYHNLDKGWMTSQIDGNLRRSLDLTLKDSQLIHQQSLILNPFSLLDNFSSLPTS